MLKIPLNEKYDKKNPLNEKYDIKNPLKEKYDKIPLNGKYEE